MSIFYRKKSVLNWGKTESHLLFSKLNQKLRGYWHYYGISGNYESLNDYLQDIKRILFKWLNRRSQRRSYNRKGFVKRWMTSNPFELAWLAGLNASCVKSEILMKNLLTNWIFLELRHVLSRRNAGSRAILRGRVQLGQIAAIYCWVAFKNF